MTAEDASEFARGMVGVHGAVSYKADGPYEFCIAIVDEGTLRALGTGHSWEEACDETVRWVDAAAKHGLGVFDPQPLPF